MKRGLVAAVLVMALPLAGCLDAGDAGDPATQGAAVGTTTRTGTGGSSNATATVGPGGNGTGNGTGDQTGPSGNATGNQTGNATGNATWEYDNRTGVVAGNAIPVVSASVKKVEKVDVANGTLNLTLNLTSTGDDITIAVAPPGCTTDACSKKVTAKSGRADFGYEDPAEGQWSVTMSVTGVGPVEAEYELTVAFLVPGNATV